MSTEPLGRETAVSPRRLWGYEVMPLVIQRPWEYEQALSLLTVWDGAQVSVVRTPSVFKTVSATAVGSTALWTPTVGKRFRLMGFIVTLTANVSLAAGGVETIALLDGTVDLNLTFSAFVPTAAVTTGEGGFTSGWIVLGNGALSGAGSNVLNVSLGTALATGACRVTCCGTEE